jgi:hypothetical protein
VGVGAAGTPCRSDGRGYSRRHWVHRFWWMALVDDAKATRLAWDSIRGERSSKLNNRVDHDDGWVFVEQRL